MSKPGYFETHKMASSPCPNCRFELDAVTHADPRQAKRQPKRGDFTVCFKCAAILAFDENLQLAFLPPEVEPPVECARLQRAMHQAWEWQARR